MSFATGVIGGSGTNVWKPDPTLTPGVDGDPFAPFELGLTVTLDDRSFQVAQFCRIGAAGLLIDATAAIVDGVTTTATEENFWTNKTGVDLVEGDYAFLFGTIINGAAAGGGGLTGTPTEVLFFDGLGNPTSDPGLSWVDIGDYFALMTANIYSGGDLPLLLQSAFASIRIGDGSTTPTNAIILETERTVPDEDGTRDLGCVTADAAVDRRFRDGWFTRNLHATTVKLTPVALASLGSAATAGEGAKAMINDANTPVALAVAAGSGGTIVPVYSDGTDWRVG